MAFAVVAHTAKNGGNTSSAINTTGASLIALGASQFSATADAGPPTDSAGNTWSSNTLYSSAPVWLKQWYAKNPAVSATHTFTLGVSTGLGMFTVAAFSGVDTVSPFDVENGHVNAASGATVQAGSVTPSQSNSLAVTQIYLADVQSSFTIDSSYTITDQLAGVGGVREGGGMAWNTVSAATNPTATANNGSGQLGMSIAVYKPPGGGGGSPVQPIIWPNPQGLSSRQALGHALPVAACLLLSIVASPPLRPVDIPTPVTVTSRVALASQILGSPLVLGPLKSQDTFFGAPGQGPNYEWPIPQRARSWVTREQPFNRGPAYLVATSAPFLGLAQPNPQVAASRAISFTATAQARTPTFILTGLVPFTSLAQPVPVRATSRHATSAQASGFALQQRTFTAPALPKSQYHWPVPQQRRPVQFAIWSQILGSHLANIPAPPIPPIPDFWSPAMETASSWSAADITAEGWAPVSPTSSIWTDS